MNLEALFWNLTGTVLIGGGVALQFANEPKPALKQSVYLRPFGVAAWSYQASCR